MLGQIGIMTWSFDIGSLCQPRQPLENDPTHFIFISQTHLQSQNKSLKVMYHCTMTIGELCKYILLFNRVNELIIERKCVCSERVEEREVKSSLCLHCV